MLEQLSTPRMISKATLLCFGTALAFATIFLVEVHGESDTADEMRGMFVQRTDYSTDDMDKFMEAMGFNDEAKKSIHDDKDLMIEITIPGENKYRIKKITKKNIWSMTFESGVESEATLFDGRKIKSTVTVDLGKKTIHRVFKMDGFEATSDYIFNGKGFELTLKAKDAKVVLTFDALNIASGGHI